MNVGIIGCGLMGHRRAFSIDKRDTILMVADNMPDKAKALASKLPSASYTNFWRDVVNNREIDIVIISVINEFLAQISKEAVIHGKHILVEKPAARNSSELTQVIKEWKQHQVIAKVGFNLRFHPAISTAKKMVNTGDIGRIMYIRGRYGQGGRPGYDKEWRADPERSGGGELIDQGVHLIDLVQWFLGDVYYISSELRTFFWNMPVEDNAFITLGTGNEGIAWLHASCTEWKNLFSFEIFGSLGKLQIDGLGGSYGVEKLTYYKMLPCMGPPETIIYEYPFEDRSYADEYAYFRSLIEKNESVDDLLETYSTLKIVESAYHGRYS